MSEKKKDWHKADIRAALEKNGTNFKKLSIENGLGATTLRQTIDRKWPKGERIIADAIGVPANQIWPSRYGEI